MERNSDITLEIADPKNTREKKNFEIFFIVCLFSLEKPKTRKTVLILPLPRGDNEMKLIYPCLGNLKFPLPFSADTLEL